MKSAGYGCSWQAPECWDLPQLRQWLYSLLCQERPPRTPSLSNFWRAYLLHWDSCHHAEVSPTSGFIRVLEQRVTGIGKPDGFNRVQQISYPSTGFTYSMLIGSI